MKQEEGFWSLSRRGLFKLVPPSVAGGRRAHPGGQGRTLQNRGSVLRVFASERRAFWSVGAHGRAPLQPLRS